MHMLVCYLVDLTCLSIALINTVILHVSLLQGLGSRGGVLILSPPLNITLVTVAVFFIIPLHTILFGDEHFVVHSITQ